MGLKSKDGNEIRGQQLAAACRKHIHLSKLLEQKFQMEVKFLQQVIFFGILMEASEPTAFVHSFEFISSTSYPLGKSVIIFSNFFLQPTQAFVANFVWYFDYLNSLCATVTEVQYHKVFTKYFSSCIANFSTTILLFFKKTK